MLLFHFFYKITEKVNINSQYLNILFDVYNVLLLMFIRLIKSTNLMFFLKIVNLRMYKICIKSYMRFSQNLVIIQSF